MSRLVSETLNLFSTTDVNHVQSASVNSRFIKAEDFRNIEFTVVLSASFAGKLEFFASQDDEEPTFASASTAGNAYFPIQIKGHDTDAGINGTDGLVFADGNDDGTYGYRLNSDIVKWVGVKLTRTAGSVCAQISMSDNQ